MDQLPKVTEPATYRVQIAGRVHDGWADFMSNLEQSFDHDNDATVTTIVGAVADQAALHGLLERIRDLNLILIAVTWVGLSEQSLQSEGKERK